MAIFKPDIEASFFNNYGERQVFKALSKLSDDYVIIYSYDWLTRMPISNVQGMGEIDFVVIHPYKGILVIEVKAGNIELDSNGKWIQHNQKTGTQKIIDPFGQARNSAFQLLDRFKQVSVVSPLINYCVWFVDYEKTGSEQYPAYMVDDILLDVNSLKQPERALDLAFDYWALEHKGRAVTTFKYKDKEQRKRYESNSKLAIKVIYPSLSFAPCLKSIINEKEERFIQLSQQQTMMLDLMKEQKLAIFDGVAGGGKTVMACIKAKMLNEKKENVLFLCFNAELREDLKLTMEDASFVEVHNVYTLANKLMNKNLVNKDITDLYNFLESYDLSKWPYKHIIIDEGQDLDDSLLDTLYCFVNELGGCFYLFYDGNQMVHKNDFGKWIKSMNVIPYTLDKNYRNTNQIFKTACSFIEMQDKYVVSDQSLNGLKPRLCYYQDQDIFNKQLDEAATYFIEEAGIEPEQFVILTTGKLEDSVLDPDKKILNKYKVVSRREQGKIYFTTIRKFKGLEAKAIMIVDVDVNSFEDKEYRDLLYVGCSRARHFLQLSIEELDRISAKNKSAIKSAFELAELNNVVLLN
ncbi:NERD domain-containing protein [Bacillus rhizoplanae]|uniref:nuclease-related domain-containing DEAD/DEAH box helicase n=1 Tax=Bacillus rhizoplanae TaxID=2880966 RepID=UPI003D20D206